MKKAINTRADIDALLPGRFCVLAELKTSGTTREVVEIERHAGNDIMPSPFLSAKGRFNNYRGGQDPNGRDSFSDLLEYCRDGSLSLVLDTDFICQRRLRQAYEADMTATQYLDTED